MEDTKDLSSCSSGKSCGVGQIVCFLGGVMILAFGIYRLWQLKPTEAQTFYGMLLILIVALLAAVLGMLLEIARSLGSKDK